MNLPSQNERRAVTRKAIGGMGSPSALGLAALFGITLAFYHGLWLPDLVLIKRDAFWIFLPIKQYTAERLASGELPHWFPYEGLGRPFIGVTATGVFHPFTALSFLFPVPDAYRLATLLCCLLAGGGAFTLGRTLKFSHPAALLAAIAFTLSGYVVSLTDNLVYLYSICLLPLFCLTLENALAGSRTWVISSATLWATVLLIGDIQTGYYYGFIGLFWSLARAPGSRLRACMKLALAGTLAALLAGVQLGPAWAVFEGSSRAQAKVFNEQALGWGTHPLRLLTVLASPAGNQADQMDVARFFFGIPNGALWAESLYLGIPLIGLALLGTRRRLDLRVLAWLGSLALLLALGRWGRLYELFFQYVPLWSAFRYPEKLMGVASFAVAMLAGAGLDMLRAGAKRSIPWFIAALLCASAAIGLRPEAASVWTATSFGAPEVLARAVTQSAAQAFLFSAIAALGVGVIVVGLKRESLPVKFLLAVLIVIVTLDLTRANFPAYHVGPGETATFTPPLVEALRASEGPLTPGRFRLISLREGTLGSMQEAPEAVRRLLGPHGTSSVILRQALDVEQNAQFHIESAKSSLPGNSAEFSSLTGQKPGIEAAARYNVAYYIGRKFHFQNPRFAEALVAQLPDYDLALIRNPSPAKPRVYLSLRPERSVMPVAPAVLLARPDFLSGDVDVIETSDEPLPGPATDGSAAIEQYTPEEVRVRVETPTPAVLVLLDAFEQGWTATLESGVELPILRANALVRSVAVPAGLHVVTFRYETPLLRAGAAVSLTGVLLCLALIAHARWRTRQSQGIP